MVINPVPSFLLYTFNWADEVNDDACALQSNCDACITTTLTNVLFLR